MSNRQMSTRRISRRICTTARARFDTGVSHRRPTLRRHLFPSWSRFHPRPQYPLTTPTNSPHSAPDRRLQPWHPQGTLQAQTTHVRMRRWTRSPRTFLPLLPTLCLSARRPDFLPTTRKPTISRLPPQRRPCDRGNPSLPCRVGTFRLALLPAFPGSLALSLFLPPASFCYAFPLYTLHSFPI